MSQLETSLVMNFTLPIEANALFTFVANSENMVLYTGCFLVPGIKHVVSSDSVRKVGTVDAVANTDGSSHDARTVIFDYGRRYSLYLDNFKLTGYKSKLATPIIAFKEDWILTPKGDSTQINRSIDIVYKKSFLNNLLVKYFIYPQLYFSFLKHHQNIAKKFA